MDLLIESGIIIRRYCVDEKRNISIKKRKQTKNI